jgi:hypothetical protein
MLPEMKSICLTLLLLFASSWAWAVPFTLHNRSLKSIPLLIPSVMNPNLSPLSKSGVELAVGQSIYFMHAGERYLLLSVTEDLRGQTLAVSRLLRARKKALGLR